MAWPKGRPRSAEDRAKISSGLSNGAAYKGTCKRCEQEVNKKGAEYCSPECLHAGPEFGAIIKARSADPKWRRKVSERTREAMQRPETRQRHLDALSCVFDLSENGNNFTGGQGQQLNNNEQLYFDILVPLGYAHNHRLKYGQGRGQYYRLDFALVEAHIAIEIDGSSHRDRQEKDELRDQRLHSLGWKVVRIRCY